MPRHHRYDDQRIDDITFAQHGLATYGQLVEAGVSSSTLTYRTRTGGPWQRVLPGIYLAARSPLTMEQRWRAARLFSGEPVLLTGVAGLVQHGVGYLPDDPATAPVHVLVPHERRRASAGFALVERTRRYPTEPQQTDQPAAPLARCLFDAARRYPDRRATRAMVLECVQRGLVDVEELTDEIVLGQRRWTAVLREVLKDAGTGIASTPEAEFRDLVVRGGLTEPLWNPRLFTPSGSFIAQPDGYVPELGLATQVDSRQHHSKGQKWDDTLRRIAAMTECGIGVWPLVVSDLRRDPRGVLEGYRSACQARRGLPTPDVRIVLADGRQWVPKPL